MGRHPAAVLAGGSHRCQAALGTISSTWAWLRLPSPESTAIAPSGVPHP